MVSSKLLLFGRSHSCVTVFSIHLLNSRSTYFGLWLWMIFLILFLTTYLAYIFINYIVSCQVLRSALRTVPASWWLGIPLPGVMEIIPAGRSRSADPSENLGCSCSPERIQPYFLEIVIFKLSVTGCVTVCHTSHKGAREWAFQTPELMHEIKSEQV